MSTPRARRHTSSALASVSLLALAVSLCGSTVNEPPPQGQNFYIADIGVVVPASARTRKPYCLDSTARWGFQVVLRNIPDMPFNAQGAMVTVNGSDGQTWSQEVGPRGSALVEWPMQQEGLIQLSVSAQMGDSTSPTERFTVEVVPCNWGFSIFFEEEYDLSDDESITVSARARVFGEVRVAGREGEPGGSQGVLELTRGGGNFSLSASDTLEPLDVHLDPAVSGSISLELRNGRSGGGQVLLSLMGSASGLPLVADLAFEDVTEQGNEIYVTAPVPTSAGVPSSREGGGFDPIERMQLSTITLPDTGGVTETSPDMVFIQSSDRIRSTATFTLWRSSESGQY